VRAKVARSELELEVRVKVEAAEVIELSNKLKEVFSMSPKGIEISMNENVFFQATFFSFFHQNLRAFFVGAYVRTL
jgi:hypothetical protein